VNLIISGCLAVISAAALLTSCQRPALAEEGVRTPAASLRSVESKGLQTAIFAGGCFWGVEAVFSHVDGVTSAVSGYHGGTSTDANYAAVSAGRTSHAEAVKVIYDPSVVRYDELLRIYFGVVADPTLLNRQGPDRGAQYRSAIVPVNAMQAKTARTYIAQLEKAGLWDSPIVTRLERLEKFYPAEKYHQDFAARNLRHPYIVTWDAPKLRKLRAIFPAEYSTSFRRG
jgi:peptide-methionine (S)-S-oxide reductase